MSDDEVPNPGSDAALYLGCTCPVMDNRRGLSPPHPPDGWWIDMSCRLHGAGGWRTPQSTAATEKCMCFYAEVDPGSEEGLCNCGHAMDEHDDEGDCQVEVSV